MKKGEEDDNAIATTAASSLLALVNGLDYKSNKFNQLDEMQNHMSNLITAQNEKKRREKTTTNKTLTRTNHILMKVLQAHQNTEKRPHKKAKRNEHLTRQAAIVIAIRYTKTS